MMFDINSYKDKYVMHCKTKKEAKDFCDYLCSVGRTWCTGASYLGDTRWERYGTDTAYEFNKGCYSDLPWYRERGYTILEWSDFMNGEITKADLKTGDVVMQRNGTVQIANCALDMFITKDHWNDMSDFNSNLTHKRGKEFDVIAVRRPLLKSDCTFKAFDYKLGTLVYERKEVEEMTLAEVCKLLGKEIKIVK